MKPKYEKPIAMDLDVPKAWGGDISPMGTCYTGLFVGQPGSCEAGSHPEEPGLCWTGAGDSGGNICRSGIAV